MALTTKFRTRELIDIREQFRAKYVEGRDDVFGVRIVRDRGTRRPWIVVTTREPREPSDLLMPEEFEGVTVTAETASPARTIS